MKKSALFFAFVLAGGPSWAAGATVKALQGDVSVRPAASKRAAVRGTLFWGLSDAAKNSAYACFTGAIQVQANGYTSHLAPGQKLTVPFGDRHGTPGPAVIPAEYLNTFSIDGGIQGLDGLLIDEQPPEGQ